MLKRGKEQVSIDFRLEQHKLKRALIPWIGSRQRKGVVRPSMAKPVTRLDVGLHLMAPIYLNRTRN